MIYPEDKVKLIEEIVDGHFDNPSSDPDSIFCVIKTICEYGEKEISSKV